MTPPPRKARVWGCADFARHAFGSDDEPSCRRARRLLKRLDAKHGGALLIPSGGSVNRAWTFYPADLARLEPQLFTPVESLEFRIEELEASDDRQTQQILALASELGRMRTRSTAA